MFTSIEIDFDVFKELTVRRSTPDVTENDVLRQLLGLQPVTSPERQSIGTGNGSFGIPWSSKGVTLPHGTKLRAEYGGRSYNARIENGAIIYDGRNYKSPSAAANAVTDKSVNGWAFWECQPPGKNNWVRMSELRDGRPEPPVPNSQRFRFWDSFLSLAEGRDLYADQKTPTRDSLYVRKWRGGGAMEGTIAYVINQHSSRVAFYTIRAEVYDALHAHKQGIEAAFGESLLWTRRESGLTSRIAYDMSIGGYEDEANWETIQNAMIDAMLRFENALSPFVANIVSGGQ
jgi:Domain of unknown function (DUF4268)/Restriction Enzyme Adenine Methylase Associated/Protein of unknown function (DUF2924)